MRVWVWVWVWVWVRTKQTTRAQPRENYAIERTDTRTCTHRLDEATSGVMVFARSPEVQASLYDQFRQRTVMGAW